MNKIHIINMIIYLSEIAWPNWNGPQVASLQTVFRTLAKTVGHYLAQDPTGKSLINPLPERNKFI